MENQENELQYDEVNTIKKVERTDSYFDGKVLELIGYKILAFIITFATLGIASAWAEKLLIAYTLEHTVYNGKRLKFEGTGASLFVQKFKWIFFTIITLGIYSLWIPIKKEKWIASNIHFEKEEFVVGDSYFDGGLLGLIGVNLFCKLLTIISFGILYPFGICYKQKWLIKHTIINRKKIIFDGKALSLIGHYLLWILLCLVTFGIYGLWLPIKIENWKAKNTHIKLKDEEDPSTSPIPGIIAILLSIIIVITFITYSVKNINKIANDGFDFEQVINQIINKNYKPSDRNNSSVKSITNNTNTNSSSKSKTNKITNTTSNKSDNSSISKEKPKYTTKDFKRYKKVTLIDSVATYRAPDHTSDMVASIEGKNIAITENMGAILIPNANAKYLYKVSTAKGNKLNLYFITNNNILYVIYNPNSSTENQKKIKVQSSVFEFLGTKTKNGEKYLTVLLTNGDTKDISY